MVVDIFPNDFQRPSCQSAANVEVGGLKTHTIKVYLICGKMFSHLSLSVDLSLNTYSIPKEQPPFLWILRWGMSKYVIVIVLRVSDLVRYNPFSRFGGSNKFDTALKDQ